MKALKIHKNLLASAVGAALAVGMVASASAVVLPQFQVDRDSNSATLNNFYASFFNGSSSERLLSNNTANTLSTAAGQTGWLNLTSYTNNGPLGVTGSILPSVSGLGVDYQLYLTFSLVAALNTGTLGGLGSTYSITNLNYNLYRDDGLNTGFVSATNTLDATVTGNATDVLLGSGNIIAGIADLNTFGGTGINATTSYTNTAAGNLFFVAPTPFYSLAFAALNNTSQGVSIVGNCATIAGCTLAVNAAGIVDFNNNRVPEPETLALLGVGLLGMGASLRKRKAG